MAKDTHSLQLNRASSASMSDEGQSKLEDLEQQYAQLEKEYKEVRKELVQADEQLGKQQAKVNNLLKLKREVGEALQKVKVAIHREANPDSETYAPAR